MGGKAPAPPCTCPFRRHKPEKGACGRFGRRLPVAASRSSCGVTFLTARCRTAPSRYEEMSAASAFVATPPCTWPAVCGPPLVVRPLDGTRVFRAARRSAGKCPDAVVTREKRLVQTPGPALFGRAALFRPARDLASPQRLASAGSGSLRSASGGLDDRLCEGPQSWRATRVAEPEEGRYMLVSAFPALLKTWSRILLGQCKLLFSDGFPNGSMNRK